MDISSLPTYQGGAEPHIYPKELAQDRDSVDFALNVAMLAAVSIGIALIMMLQQMIGVMAMGAAAAALAAD
jgi:hypothetical protein